ncbi:DUF6093 family protein [Microbacterium esteraromaticum]|nr:DUF6093 family protein [Microbacterium esteraromaticum]
MLGADVAAALPELRAQAESRMSEKVTAGWLVDGTDPETGEPTQTVQTPVYPVPGDTSPDAGRARIRWASSTVSDAQGAGEPISVQEPVLSIPVGSPRLLDGMAVVVASSTADGLLVGRVFTVQGAPVSGQVTSHRYLLEEVG